MPKFTLPILALLAVALFAAGCDQEAFSVTVTVNVKDVDRKPVAGADVYAYAPYSITGAAAGQGFSITGEAKRKTETDAQGVAKMQLVAGKYGFRASKGDDTTGVAEAQIVTDRPNVIEITIRKLPAGQKANQGSPTKEEYEAAAKALSGPPAPPQLK